MISDLGFIIIFLKLLKIKLILLFLMCFCHVIGPGVGGADDGRLSIISVKYFLSSFIWNLSLILATIEDGWICGLPKYKKNGFISSKYNSTKKKTPKN